MVRRRLLNALLDTLYGPLAPAYDPISWVISSGRWRSWQRVARTYVTGSRIVEVGCGPGHLAAILTAHHDRVIAVDRSPSMCRLARRRLARIERVTVVQADGRALPFPSAVFDTAVLTFPARSLLESATIRELARVVRSGGRCVIVLGVTRPGTFWRLLTRVVGVPAIEQMLVGRLAAAGFQSCSMEAEVVGDRVSVLVGQRASEPADEPTRWHRSCSSAGQNSLSRSV